MANLTQARLKELLHYDPGTGDFHRRVTIGPHALAGSIAGTTAFRNGTPKYRQIQIDGKIYLSHRLASLYMTGAWPEALNDHRDRNGLNNRWENLRPATPSQNQQNSCRRSHNSTGLKGVVPYRGAWRACIALNGRRILIGMFETPEGAHAAYVAAATELFGEFARVA